MDYPGTDPTPDFSPEATEEALREATPGDHWWTDEYQDEDGRYNVWAAQDPNRDSSNGVITSYGGPSFEDAHLIANAPTWLAQLLAALEAERVAHVDAIFDARDRLNTAEAALEAKDGEVARLRVAWQRSFAMLRATYPHPDHVPLVVERVIDMMAAALAPSTPKEGEK